MRKPPIKNVWEGVLECRSEDPDDMGGGCYCVILDCPSIYSSKEVRKVIKWLEKAEKWIAAKEKYETNDEGE